MTPKTKLTGKHQHSDEGSLRRRSVSVPHDRFVPEGVGFESLRARWTLSDLGMTAVIPRAFAEKGKPRVEPRPMTRPIPSAGGLGDTEAPSRATLSRCRAGQMTGLPNSEPHLVRSQGSVGGPDQV
jgi:hypothetical protein